MKVTVICLTYNHEKYLRDALEGFISQKTNFDFEVLVHDDASTDSTPDILKAYAENHPLKIKGIFEKTNQFSTGTFTFVNDLFRQARGEYIALCEGDDFWTDPDKLQSQVEFMDANTDRALCFHRVKVFTEHSKNEDYIYPDPSKNIDFSVQELLRQNYIQTNSVMYRKQSYKKLPAYVIPSDWYMHLYHAQFGEIGFIDKVMSSYRKHPDGVWWDSSHDADKFWTRHGVGHFALFAEIMKLYGNNPAYEPIISNWIALVLSKLISIDDKYHSKLAETALSRYPQPEAYYVKSLGRSMEKLLEKEALTQNHIRNLEDQLQGHVAYIRKLERDVHSTTDELRSVHSSAAYKVLKRLNHKFSEDTRK